MIFLLVRELGDDGVAVAPSADAGALGRQHGALAAQTVLLVAAATAPEVLAVLVGAYLLSIGGRFHVLINVCDQGAVGFHAETVLVFHVGVYLNCFKKRKSPLWKSLTSSTP